MTQRTLEVNGATTTIASSEAPQATGRSCALLRITVRDEMTDRAPLAAVTARLIGPRRGNLLVRVLDGGGLVGVSGRVDALLSPGLTTTVRLEMEVRAPGYVDRRVSIQFACGVRTLANTASGNALVLSSTASLAVGQRLMISTSDGARVELGAIAALGPGPNAVRLTQPLSANYPQQALVQPLAPDAVLYLHRSPVSIRGRVLQSTGATVAPLLNAPVRISKVWRVLPAPGAVANPEPPTPGLTPAGTWPAPIAALWPPLYADVPQGTTLTVENRAVDVSMPDARLVADAPLGSQELRLAGGASLTANDVIAIDDDEPERREIVLVSNVTASGAANGSVRVGSNQPFASGHRRGVVVRRLQAAAATLSRVLNYDGARGDEAILFDTTGFSGTHQICLTPPGLPAQRSFHRARPFVATSDAEGFFRLPPLSRAAKIEIQAGPPASKPVQFIPDYERPENHIDIVV